MDIRNGAARLVASIALLFLASCGEPTVDGSTKESLKTSMDDMRAGLSEADRADFDEAVKVLMFSGLDMKALFSGTSSVEDMTADFSDVVDGMTAGDIMARSEIVLAERREKEKAQALEEIAELLAKKQQAAADSLALEQFEVVRSRYYLQDEKYLFAGDPIIELTVRNGTSHAVSQAHFMGTLASPGRSIPWVNSAFIHSISGGIEPGEEVTWKLSPGSYGDWGNKKIPADVVLTVAVTQIDGVDEEPLFSSRGFTDADAERLVALEEEYGSASD